MTTIAIRPELPEECSRVIVGTGLLPELPELIDRRPFSRVAVIAGSRTARHWLAPVRRALGNPLTITLPTARPRKTLATAERLYDRLYREGFDRRSLIVTLGGGVIGDLGGYVAATYLRGVAYVQIPTTLLAQADASIGGKVGLNLGDFKNGIGAFQLPRLVVSDTDTLATLPPRELRNGLAEIIKLGLITDRKLFEMVGRNETNELVRLITRAVRGKARIVARDEREQGPRKLLNFGHTIGHALESLSLRTTRPLRHGEAVSLGMLAESRLAAAAGTCPATIPEVLDKTLRHVGLPTKISAVSIPQAMRLIERDKKNRRSVVSWTLPTGLGRGRYDQTAPASLVRNALHSLTL